MTAIEKLKLLVVHVFSLHTLVMAIGWGIAITGGAVPALAPYHALFVALGGIFNVAGLSMAANADPETFKMRAGIRRPSLAPPNSSSSLRVFLPFVLLAAPTLALNACAFGTCLLSHLKASAQTLIVDATEALGGASWETDLGLLVGEVGPDLVNCTVQAIVQHEQAKRDALAKLEQSRVAPDGGAAPVPTAALVLSPVLIHGTQWLAKHPATACKDAKPKRGEGDYGHRLAAARIGGVL